MRFLAIALLLTTPALAETRVWRNGEAYICASWAFDIHCRLDWRTNERREIYRREERRERVMSWERREDRSECRDSIAVVGAEKVQESDARTAAERVWMEATRFRHGERFMSIDSARDARYACTRSSTNDTTAGKIAEAVTGAFLTRCEFIASPCSVIPSPAGQER